MANELEQAIYTARVFNSETVNGSRTTKTSDHWRTKNFAKNGFFSVYLAVTGSGRVDLTYLISHDGSSYVTPSSATSIVSGFTASSGTSGQDVFGFSPELAPFMKLKITNTQTNLASTVTADCWMAMG